MDGKIRYMDAPQIEAHFILEVKMKGLRIGTDISGLSAVELRAIRMSVNPDEMGFKEDEHEGVDEE